MKIKSVLTDTFVEGTSKEYDVPVAPSSVGIFAESDFSNGNKGMTGQASWASSRNDVTVSSNFSKSGTHSLRMAFKTRNAAEQRFKFPTRMQEVWCSYDFFIPSNYYHGNFPDSPPADNNKGSFFIWGNDGTKGNDGYGTGIATTFKNEWKPSGNSDGGSIVEGNVSRKTYQNGSETDKKVWRFGGNTHGLPSEYYGRNQHIKPSDFGKWQTIIAHVINATPQNGGFGSYEVWARKANGQLDKLINLHELPFQATETDGSPSKGYNAGYFLGASNSGWGEETVFYLDNFKFSTQSLL